MFNWLGVVTMAVLYNLWACILRQAFREVQSSCHSCWFAFDAVVDIIYLLDILVQFRTGYLNQVGADSPLPPWFFCNTCPIFSDDLHLTHEPLSPPV